MSKDANTPNTDLIERGLEWLQKTGQNAASPKGFFAATVNVMLSSAEQIADRLTLNPTQQASDPAQPTSTIQESGMSNFTDGKTIKLPATVSMADLIAGVQDFMDGYSNADTGLRKDNEPFNANYNTIARGNLSVTMARKAGSEFEVCVVPNAQALQAATILEKYGPGTLNLLEETSRRIVERDPRINAPRAWADWPASKSNTVADMLTAFQERAQFVVESGDPDVATKFYEGYQAPHDIAIALTDDFARVAKFYSSNDCMPSAVPALFDQEMRQSEAMTVAFARSIGMKVEAPHLAETTPGNGPQIDKIAYAQVGKQVCDPEIGKTQEASMEPSR